MSVLYALAPQMSEHRSELNECYSQSYTACIYIYISFSYLYKYSEQTNTCEFRKAVNLAYGQEGLKLEINILPQHILAKSKGRLIIERGVSSNKYGTRYLVTNLLLIFVIKHVNTAFGSCDYFNLAHCQAQR